MRSAALVVALALGGCTSPPSPLDGEDGGRSDGVDGGLIDAGEPAVEGGLTAPDGGLPWADGGAPCDGGFEADAGALGDGGAGPDAGTPEDAGLPWLQPNLIRNAGFETGGAAPAEWLPGYGTLAMVDDPHRGQRSARITAAATGASLGYGAAIIANEGPLRTFCAAAWMKGSSPVAKLSLTVGGAGGGTEYTFTSPLGPDWIRLPLSTNLKVPVPPGQTLQLRFVGLGSALGQTVQVDDVDIWEDPTGTCAAPRD